MADLFKEWRSASRVQSNEKREYPSRTHSHEHHRKEQQLAPKIEQSIAHAMENDHRQTQEVARDQPQQSSRDLKKVIAPNHCDSEHDQAQCQDSGENVRHA